MKTINRVLTALLAAVMAFSLSAPALAIPASAVPEYVKQKYKYNFNNDPLGLFLWGDRGYRSGAIAAIAGSVGEDTEEYLYALAKAGIITILVRSTDWFEIFAGSNYPDGNGDLPTGAAGKNVPEYDDVAPEAWYYDAVMEVSRGKLMSGDDAGLFRPDSEITVAEFSTVLCRIYNLPIEVFGGPWYGPYIDAVAVAGLDFSSCRYEQATEAVTRGEAIEAMVVMLRARGGERKRALTWGDVEDAGACRVSPAGHGWDAPALLDALNYGVIDGTNASSYRVNAANPLTRAELCKLLQNIGITSTQSVNSYRANEVYRQYTGR